MSKQPEQTTETNGQGQEQAERRFPHDFIGQVVILRRRPTGDPAADVSESGLHTGRIIALSDNGHALSLRPLYMLRHESGGAGHFDDYWLRVSDYWLLDTLESIDFEAAEAAEAATSEHLRNADAQAANLEQLLESVKRSLTAAEEHLDNMREYVGYCIK